MRRGDPDVRRLVWALVFFCACVIVILLLFKAGIYH